MEKYVPELGQLCFGQPHQQYAMPENIRDKLRQILEEVVKKTGLDPSHK